MGDGPETPFDRLWSGGKGFGFRAHCIFLSLVKALKYYA